MTKAQRERVRRHAAMVAIAPSTMPPIDTEADRLQGLRQWRGMRARGHTQADVITAQYDEH